MFKIRLKFKKGAMKKKLRFAFKPTLIDGGSHIIWLKFYYELYKRDEGYLNWDKPDIFRSIGSFSKKGTEERFNNIKWKNPDTHWAKDDDFKVGFMKSKKDFKEEKHIQ